MPAHDDHTSQLFADAYSDLIEAAPVAPTLEEITTLSVNSSTGGKPPRKTSRVWVAIAAAAAVVLVIGLIPLLVNDQGTPSADTVVPTTLVESTPTTLGELVLIPGTWSRVPYSEAGFGEEFEQFMSGVAVGGPGLVAVGGADTDAAVWTSVDGIAWSRIPNEDGVFSGAGISSVTRGGPGLVAVGQVGPDAAVWTSIDGITWTRVPQDEAVFGGEEGPIFGGAGMSSVTVGGPGLVAVGSDGSPLGGGDAAVWTSVDGIIWSRVAHDEAVFGGKTDGYYGQSMSSVTAWRQGLVAVGFDVERAAVWTSPDGITWSRVPHDEAVFGGEEAASSAASMSSVTVGGPGLVAVGLAGHPDGDYAAVWTSPDGITWSQVPHDETTFGGARMSSVTVGGPGLVAVGWDTMGAAVWTSVDGITWSRVPHDEAVFGARPDLPALEMRSITAGGPGLVVVGANGVHPTFGATKSDAAVWVTEED